MEWIPIANLRPRVERNLQGVKVDVLVSPYDVPEALRGYYSPDKQCFVIEFKYISSEDTVEKDECPNVQVRVGKNSGRLYAIELAVKSFDASAVQLRIKVAEALRNVLTHLIQEPIAPSRSSNYSMAKDAVEKLESQILQPV
jgi:hypothetical protein